MQWPKRGSGHSNAPPPTGTIHAFGGLTDGIIETQTLRNSCIICDRKNALSDKISRKRKQYQSLIAPCYACLEVNENKKQIARVKEKINKIKKICMKFIHPSDNSCGCKKIPKLRSKLTRFTKKGPGQCQVIFSNTCKNIKEEINGLVGQCDKVVHNKKMQMCTYSRVIFQN